MRRAFVVALIPLGLVASLAVLTSRTAVPAGQAASRSFEDCPGHHRLPADCDMDALGGTEIQVVQPSRPEAGPSGNAFGVRTGSDLVVWAGALVGVALLVASIGINWRRRA
jgi:hypothetical protein